MSQNFGCLKAQVSFGPSITDTIVRSESSIYSCCKVPGTTIGCLIFLNDDFCAETTRSERLQILAVVEGQWASSFAAAGDGDCDSFAAPTRTLCSTVIDKTGFPVSFLVDACVRAHKDVYKNMKSSSVYLYLYTLQASLY